MVEYTDFLWASFHLVYLTLYDILSVIFLNEWACHGLKAYGVLSPFIFLNINELSVYNGLLLKLIISEIEVKKKELW